MSFNQMWSFHRGSSWRTQLWHKYKVNQCVRVSKSGRHTVARLRKFFHNLRKILAFELRKCKQYLFKPDFTDCEALFLCFMAIPAHFYVQFFLDGNFVCAMKITFRKSAKRYPCPVDSWPVYYIVHDIV